MKNSNLDPEESSVVVPHLFEPRRGHAHGNIVKSLKSFQVGDGDLDKALYEQPCQCAPACCRPDCFEGLMGFPPVAVIEQVDTI